MGKYRKKPVVIEAEQFFENSLKGWPTGVYKDSKSSTGFAIDINILEGRYEVSEGDWIIRDVCGELYPCKPDIFEQTYEEVKGKETYSHGEYCMCIDCLSKVKGGPK